MSNSNMIYYALACIGLALLVGVLAGAGFFISRRRRQLQMQRASFGGSSCILTIIVVGHLAACIIRGKTSINSENIVQRFRN